MLLVGNASNSDVAMLSAPRDVGGVPRPLQILQKLYICSSDKGAPSFFGHLLAVRAAGLLVLASASSKSVYAVHLTGILHHGSLQRRPDQHHRIGSNIVSDTLHILPPPPQLPYSATPCLARSRPQTN